MYLSAVPRRVINPRCGSNWYTTSWGTDQTAQYVGPGKVNFYRVAANYFFGTGANRYFTIQTQNGGAFTICTSRTYEWPQQNSTASSTGSTAIEQSCSQISGNSFSYDLSSACQGYYTITQCPDLYVSVQATTNTTSCNQDACQTPDQWRYIVSMANMGCYSGVSGLAASFLTVLVALLLQRIVQ